MMSASQPQCSNLQSLADALAVDFAGACVRPQTQRLFKLVFPDAPAVSLALLARNQLVGSLDLSAGGGAFTAIRSSQATAAEACIRTNAACCSVSSDCEDLARLRQIAAVPMLVSVPVHAAHTSAEAVGALSLGAPADGLAPSEAGKLCLLAQLVTEAFHRLQGCEYSSDDSDDEEVDLGEEWNPGHEHLFDLHSFYDGLYGSGGASGFSDAGSSCISATWSGGAPDNTALESAALHEWTRSEEVAGRDADPRQRAGRADSWCRRSTPLRTSSRISSDDVFMRLSG